MLIKQWRVAIIELRNPEAVTVVELQLPKCRIPLTRGEGVRGIHVGLNRVRVSYGAPEEDRGSTAHSGASRGASHVLEGA